MTSNNNLQKQRANTMGLEQTNRAAHDVGLFHAERGSVMLSDYWRERPTVFIFLRHFG